MKAGNKTKGVDSEKLKTPQKKVKLPAPPPDSDADVKPNAKGFSGTGNNLGSSKK